MKPFSASGSSGYSEQIVEFTDALSHPARWRILQELSQGVRTNGELTRLLPQAQATVSQHIKVLKEAGLIHAEGVGTSMHYSLNPTGIRKLKRALGELIRELPNFTPTPHPRSS
jgi:DNA-binding transcriptional ArsR family regulator